MSSSPRSTPNKNKLTIVHTGQKNSLKGDPKMETAIKKELTDIKTSSRKATVHPATVHPAPPSQPSYGKKKVTTNLQDSSSEQRSYGKLRNSTKKSFSPMPFSQLQSFHASIEEVSGEEGSVCLSKDGDQRKNSGINAVFFEDFDNKQVMEKQPVQVEQKAPIKTNFKKMSKMIKKQELEEGRVEERFDKMKARYLQSKADKTNKPKEADRQQIHFQKFPIETMKSTEDSRKLSNEINKLARQLIDTESTKQATKKQDLDLAAQQPKEVVALDVVQHPDASQIQSIEKEFQVGQIGIAAIQDQSSKANHQKSQQAQQDGTKQKEISAIEDNIKMIQFCSTQQLEVKPQQPNLIQFRKQQDQQQPMQQYNLQQKQTEFKTIVPQIVKAQLISEVEAFKASSTEQTAINTTQYVNQANNKPPSSPHEPAEPHFPHDISEINNLQTSIISNVWIKTEPLDESKILEQIETKRKRQRSPINSLRQRIQHSVQEIRRNSIERKQLQKSLEKSKLNTTNYSNQRMTLKEIDKYIKKLLPNKPIEKPKAQPVTTKNIALEKSRQHSDLITQIFLQTKLNFSLRIKTNQQIRQKQQFMRILTQDTEQTLRKMTRRSPPIQQRHEALATRAIKAHSDILKLYQKLHELIQLNKQKKDAEMERIKNWHEAVLTKLHQDTDIEKEAIPSVLSEYGFPKALEDQQQTGIEVLIKFNRRLIQHLVHRITFK